MAFIMYVACEPRAFRLSQFKDVMVLGVIDFFISFISV